MRFVLALFLLISNVALAAENRVALVIGNNAYKDSPLTAPINDARALASALTELGFKVTKLENVG